MKQAVDHQQFERAVGEVGRRLVHPVTLVQRWGEAHSPVIKRPRA
jgi:hypothetical protein